MADTEGSYDSDDSGNDCDHKSPPEEKIARLKDLAKYYLINDHDVRNEIATGIVDMIFTKIGNNIDPSTMIPTIISSFTDDQIRIFEQQTGGGSADFIEYFIRCSMYYFPTNWKDENDNGEINIEFVDFDSDDSNTFSDANFVYSLSITIDRDTRGMFSYSISFSLDSVQVDKLEINGQEYREIKEFSSGSFGKVCRAIRSCDNVCVAIKLGPIHDLKNDLQFSKSCVGPGVIPVISTCNINVITAIVMPFFKNLSNYMAQNLQMPFSKRIGLFFQLLCILQRIYGLGVIHQDIKGPNIVVDDTDPNNPKIVIIDGGSMTTTDQTTSHLELVTRWWKNPRNSFSWQHYGKIVSGSDTDSWAALVVGLEILNNGKVPHWLTFNRIEELNHFFKYIQQNQSEMADLLRSFFEGYLHESESHVLIKRMYDFFCKYMNVKKAMTFPYTINEIVEEMTAILKECTCRHFEEVCAGGGCVDDVCAGAGPRAGGGSADDVCARGSCSGGGGHADDVCAGAGPRAGCGHADVCIFCKMKFSTHGIMPCKHRIMCRNCAADQNKIATLNRKCPICSGPLNFTIRSLSL